MDSVLLWLGALVALALLGRLAWVSVQSLLQARLLFRSARRFGVAVRDGEATALGGRAVVERPLSLWGMTNLLYYKIEFYELDWVGRRRRWHKVGEEEKLAGVALEIESRRIDIDDMPTEVQSTRSRTESNFDLPVGLASVGGDRGVTEPGCITIPRDRA